MYSTQISQSTGLIVKGLIDINWQERPFSKVKQGNYAVLTQNSVKHSSEYVKNILVLQCIPIYIQIKDIPQPWPAVQMILSVPCAFTRSS